MRGRGLTTVKKRKNEVEHKGSPGLKPVKRIVQLPDNIIHWIFQLALYVKDLSTGSPMKTAAILSRVSSTTARWMRPVLWGNVHISNAGQALALFSGLLHCAFKPHAATYIRSLWIRADRTTIFDSDPRFQSAHWLKGPLKEVESALVTANTPQNLAVDITLLSEGWFISTNAQPSQVVLLESEDLIVGVPWHKVAPLLPLRAPFASFKALTHLCVQLPACMNPSEALNLVLLIMNSRKFVRLVICLDNGLSTTCPVNNIVWDVLSTSLSRQIEKKLLILFPRAMPMSVEWDGIIGIGRSIWDRINDPKELEPREAEPFVEEDYMKFHGVGFLKRDLEAEPPVSIWFPPLRYEMTAEYSDDDDI